ncbi:hypothetical protein [Lactiplantibacillus plajomi]|uniref:Uncharacterized protein n=1 Tax=Lactiplantibacillus plajomi TaxID=1457217 RepID=A0ABV6K241_9LACO|nr:hypothetical protein [Lactiplantibacillus plajomi]
MDKQLQYFIQNHFQTRFRFRNAFESRLTFAILRILIKEHPESLLLTKSEIEQLAGIKLEAPVLIREYFPQRSVVILLTALDELITLNLQEQSLHGQIRYPLFQSVQLDERLQELVLNLNVKALPQLTRWSVDLKGW